MEHYIDALTDFRMPLSEMKKLIDALILTYGEQALISADAGANNVCVNVVTQ